MQPLTVPGNLDSLDPIGQYVLDAASEAGLDKKVSYRLRLAVDEIVTNIIVHGYDEAGKEGDVNIEGVVEDDKLTIRVEDTATPYDPYTTVLPDLNLPVEERPIGGLGVYFAIKNVDKFTYEYVNGHNRNTFVINLPRS